MTYNVNRHQPITMKVDRINNPADQAVNYSYDYYDAQGKNNNRIRHITDHLDPNYTTNYNYDAYNRLDTVQNSVYTRVYTYDAWGNRRGDAYTGQTYHYAVNATGAPATNRLASVTLGGVTQATYSYDAAGNTIAGEGKTFAYDGANRLKAVNGGTSTYGYDGDGKRVLVTDNGTGVFYVYSTVIGQAVMEVRSTAMHRAYVYGAGKLIAQQATDGQFYWLHANHLGSARALTDASGALVYRGQFDPYGQLLTEWSATSNPNLNQKKFTGYERDAATGLDYAQARMYNSLRGRFMQADPGWLQATSLRRPQTLNRYSYVNNDPVNFVDPSGNNPIAAAIANAIMASLTITASVTITANVSGPLNMFDGGMFLPEEGSVDSGVLGGQGGESVPITRLKDCQNKYLPDGNTGGKARPDGLSIALALRATGENIDDTNFLLAIWAKESNFELRPTGDHGPMQLTSWWRRYNDRNKLDLIVPGAYDPFPRAAGSSQSRQTVHRRHSG